MTRVSAADTHDAYRDRIAAVVAVIAPPEPPVAVSAFPSPVPPDSPARRPARGKMRATPRCRARRAGRRSDERPAPVPAARTGAFEASPAWHDRARRPAVRPALDEPVGAASASGASSESDVPSCVFPIGWPACALHRSVRLMNIVSTARVRRRALRCSRAHASQLR